MALHRFIWNQSFWIPGRWGEVFDLNRFDKHRGDHHEYLNALFLVRGASQAHTFINMAEIQNNFQVYHSHSLSWVETLTWNQLTGVNDTDLVQDQPESEATTLKATLRRALEVRT